MGEISAPDPETMFARAGDPGILDAFGIEPLVERFIVCEKAVVFAAGNPEQTQLTISTGVELRKLRRQITGDG